MSIKKPISSTQPQTEEISCLEYARRKGQSLTWVYAQVRLGKLPAYKKDRQWHICVEVGCAEDKN